MRLPPSVVERLITIARREGLTYGGHPSVAQAVAWLADRDARG